MYIAWHSKYVPWHYYDSMSQLRELENSHHEKLTELGLQYLENAIKGCLEEEPPEELRKVC